MVKIGSELWSWVYGYESVETLEEFLSGKQHLLSTTTYPIFFYIYNLKPGPKHIPGSRQGKQITRYVIWGQNIGISKIITYNIKGEDRGD